MRILVAYGSKRGGTAGLAAQVGDALGSRGFSVDVRAAADVSDADVLHYHAVVVGGALYMNLWHRHARGFVQRNVTALRRRPVWFFSSGPLDGTARTKVVPPTRAVQRLMGRVGALGHVTFGGRLARDARGFPASAMARKRSGDWRDVSHVRDWVEGIARWLNSQKPVEERVDAVSAPKARNFSLSAVALTVGALLGAVTASVGILLWEGAFPAPSAAAPVNTLLAEARGWSLVTLLVTPGAAIALAAAHRGSLRGRLVWAGCMAYLVYTYLEFAVSGPFTALFLVYVVTLALAVPSLVAAVASVNVATLPRWFSGRTPRRLTAAVALLFACGLAAAWLKGIVLRFASADFGWPDAYGSVGQVVHALDLGLLVPLGIAAGILLLRRRPAGYLIAAIWLVVALEMGGALTAMVAFSAVATRQSALVAAPFGVLPLVAGALGVVFFRAVRAPTPLASSLLPKAEGAAPQGEVDVFTVPEGGGQPAFGPDNGRMRG
jgi:menaquinone-dependent protoporphyrinogen oxidase